MASIGRDPRTGNVVIRAYAGINPTTKKDRTISKTLPADATDEEIERAAAELDVRAEVTKKNSALMTISSVVHYYLDTCELTEMSPATLEPYRSYTRRHVDPRIGKVLFDQAEASTFALFYRDLRRPKEDGGAGLAITTVEKIHAMLSGCFNKLKADGVIDRNPLLGVKVPRGYSPEVKPLMKHDFTKLVGYLREIITSPVEDDESFERHMFAVLLWSALNGGFRRGELAGFQLEHWGKRGGEWGFRVARVLIQVRKKGMSEPVTAKKPKSLKSKRIVSMDGESARIINGYIPTMRYVLAEHGVPIGNETPMFCHADGSPLEPREITEGFGAICKSLGLAKGVHLHTLRHTHATYLIEHGATIKDIQERLGHASSQTTMDIYGHLLPGRDAETARTFAGIVEEMQKAPSIEAIGAYAPKCPLSGKTCARFINKEEHHHEQEEV